MFIMINKEWPLLLSINKGGMAFFCLSCLKVGGVAFVFIIINKGV